MVGWERVRSETSIRLGFVEIPGLRPGSRFVGSAGWMGTGAVGNVDPFGSLRSRVFAQDDTLLGRGRLGGMTQA